MNNLKIDPVVIWLVVGIGILCSPLVAPAQMQHEQHRTVIDGRSHPERIPDATAYRLFFLAVTTTEDTTQEQAKENAHLGGVGVDLSDAVALKFELENFRHEYDAMARSYNSVPHSSDTEYGHFQEQVDELVQSTRDKLHMTLSQDGYAILQAHVQSEKKGMRIVQQ